MKLPVSPKKEITPVTTAEDLEEACATEVNEVLDAFKARAKNENARLLDATDSEHWFAVCFQTREMKEEFLTKIGLMKLGDKYLDGMKVAKALGIPLESPVPPNRKITRFKRGNVPIIP